MLRILTLFTLILSAEAFSQSPNISVNPKYKKAPLSIARSPIKLAQYLTEDDSSEFQKALNIYTWIVNNIKYDVKSLKKVKPKIYSLKQTLRRKKGVSYQYSRLFTALCQNAGISSREIIGYSRGFTYHEGDSFFEADHSWNSVKLGSSWYLVDVTWGSGSVYQKKRRFKELQFKWFEKPYINDKYEFRSQSNYQYFLSKPELLIIDHLPVDPNWQLLEFPISISTFESSEWKSYSPRKDSLYQKQVDPYEYARVLNKYEYLSDLQYLQLTAERGNLFNPKNLKLLGLLSYSIAKSYENTSGHPDKRLEAYLQANQHHKQAISQLKQHQKIAVSESNKVIKNSKNRISNELTKPISDRVRRCDNQNKKIRRAVSKDQKIIERHENQILKFQNVISKGFPPFKTPPPFKKEKLELVEENKSKIKNTLKKVSNYEDSVFILIKNLNIHISDREAIQKNIVRQYQKLTTYSVINIRSIAQNFELNSVSNSMHKTDSVGQITDNLINNKKEMDLLIKQDRSRIKQLHSSNIASLIMVKKLTLQNCQLSRNKICEDNLYNSSNHRIKSIYKTKKQLENKFLEVAKHNELINQELKKALGVAHKTLTINSEFISLFQERKLSGVYFKLKKSNIETNRLISSSQESMRKLVLEISKLKNEIKKNKSI